MSLYCALDQEHSERLIEEYEKEAGVSVRPRFDTEASKTVGLVSAIIEEAQRPRCDVFWSNELAQTVRLGQKGLLAAYVSPSAHEIPARYRDAAGQWTGFAARARILIVSASIPEAERPTSMWDLIDSKWKGRCGIARPLTGTTLTHFAALRVLLGDREFNRWIDGMFANDVAFLQSNGATMRAVATGRLAWAFTDTDDFHVALLKGHDVVAVFPDRGQDQVGTMLIPNSVGIVKGCPHPKAARALVDWILSERVEAMLAAAKSAQIPLRAGVPGPSEPQILGVGEFKAMSWDPVRTARSLEATAALLARRFGS